jgi:thiol-disulfide isomerase/thioredoxin
MTISDLTIETRHDLVRELEKNQDVIILKLGADWCGPCKTIESLVKQHMESMPSNVTCVVIDVDDSFDLYALLKSKRVVTGIPAILAYEKGNTTIFPNEFVIGTNEQHINVLFDKYKN